MAWISSGVKPFTTRSMMVAARCPLRNSCSAATVLAGSRPIRRGGVESSVALGEWQPEQDSAPGGASAAIAVTGRMLAPARMPAAKAKEIFMASCPGM